MPRICIAGGCSNQTSETVSLHKFPIKDRKRCALWNRFVRVKRADWTGPSAHSILCSAHFLRSDFDRSLQHQLGFSKKPVLNDDAVPSVYASTHRKVATDASGTEIVTSSGDELKPKRRKRKRSAALDLDLVKLSAHRVSLKVTIMRCFQVSTLHLSRRLLYGAHHRVNFLATQTFFFCVQ